MFESKTRLSLRLALSISARVAAFIGRQKDRARQHAAVTHGRQGQSRIYSSTLLLSQPS